MDSPVEFKTVKLTEAQQKARVSRARGVGVSLALLILVLYGASWAQLLG